MLAATLLANARLARSPMISLTSFAIVSIERRLVFVINMRRILSVAPSWSKLGSVLVVATFLVKTPMFNILLEAVRLAR